MEHTAQQHAVRFWDVDICAQVHGIGEQHLGVTITSRSGIDEICLVKLTDASVEETPTFAELKASIETREDLVDVDPQSIFVIVYRTSRKEGGKIRARLGTHESFGPDIVLYHFNQLYICGIDQFIPS